MRSALLSSHSLMHHDSAQDIHDCATRFLRPRRILSSMVDMDAEREKEDEKEDELEDVDDRTLPESPTSSISIHMDRPRAGRAVLI
jgi:hypothetical protein